MGLLLGADAGRRGACSGLSTPCMSMQYLAVVVPGRRRAGARRTPSRSTGGQPWCGARPPSARNSKEAEQRTGDATLSDEHHAEHREGCGDVEAEQFWEDRYRRRRPVWSGRPNPVLVDVVGSLRPGTALDLGCGEGGDAIWLARQGWRVTAVDISTTALDRAAADAPQPVSLIASTSSNTASPSPSPQAPSSWSPPSTCT